MGEQTLNPALRLLNEEVIHRETERLNDVANNDDINLVACGEEDRVEIRLQYDVGGRLDAGDIDATDFSLNFEGGVTADVDLHGTEDLLSKVRHEIERAQEDWRARVENSDGYGGMLTSHHQQRVLKEYPRPLNMLASDIIAQNERIYLRGRKQGTYGAEAVREQGLTTNQQHWIETLGEEVSDADD